jgi:hypothetical protein
MKICRVNSPLPRETHTLSVLIQHIPPMEISSMMGCNFGHMAPNEGGCLSTEKAILSPNEIVNRYISDHSAEFRELDELRYLVRIQSTRTLTTQLIVYLGMEE